MSNPFLQNSQAMGNPVLPVYAADPHADIFGDRYYIYATNAGIYSSAKAFHEKAEGEEHGFAVWSSTDLRHWKSEGRILHFADIEWAGEMGDAWAPCIAERNGRYYFYFCANSCIGVVVGDSPTGPFRDVLGQPLVAFREDLSSIDPMVFIDDDGQAYCYWGAIPGIPPGGHTGDVREHLTLRRLKADMVTFEGEELPTIRTGIGHHSLNHIEASHVFKRNGIYYLMWSPGDFASNDDHRAYRVHYATSHSPLGPWKKAANNPVLSTCRDVEVVGPGHHSTIQILGTDEWFCVYHAHKGNCDRRTFIDRMTFAVDGAIETIIPTLTGPPLRPLPIALSIHQQGPYQSGENIRLEVRMSREIQNKTRQVEFFSGPDKVGQAPSHAPMLDWHNASVGFHRLTARLALDSGEYFTSAPLNIDVC